MRLTEYQRNSIKEAVHQYLPDARVLLYGSRTDDSKRGGDIDLLVLADRKGDFKLEVNILMQMYDKIGEQKIDLLIEEEGHLRNFAQIVFPQAIPL